MGFLINLLFMLSFLPFIGLVLTILIEWGIYSATIRKKFWVLLGYSALINGLTNPLANLLFSQINLFTFFIAIELLVTTIEIFLVKHLLRITYKKAILISIIANTITAFLSVLVR